MLDTPDTTRNEIIAIVTAIVTALLVYLVPDATDAQKTTISGAIVAVATAAFLIADAVKRHGRAKIAAELIRREAPTAAVVD